jgi:hypothetical protein
MPACVGLDTRHHPLHRVAHVTPLSPNHASVGSSLAEAPLRWAADAVNGAPCGSHLSGREPRRRCFRRPQWHRAAMRTFRSSPPETIPRRTIATPQNKGAAGCRRKRRGGMACLSVRLAARRPLWLALSERARKGLSVRIRRGNCVPVAEPGHPGPHRCCSAQPPMYDISICASAPFASSVPPSSGRCAPPRSTRSDRSVLDQACLTGGLLAGRGLWWQTDRCRVGHRWTAVHARRCGRTDW